MRWKIISFSDIARQFNDTHSLVPNSEWTPKETAVVNAIQAEAWRICNSLTGSYDPNGSRRIVIGLSGTAQGWTDGETYVAIERKWLARHLDLGIENCIQVGALVLHEFCHDEADAASHVHSPEFYEKFHHAAIEGWVAYFADGLFKGACERFEREGRALSKKMLKIKDKIIRNDEAGKKLSEAEQRIAALQKPKTAPAKAEPEAKEPKAKEPKAKSGLYRGKYGVLFEAAQDWIGKERLCEKVAAKTGQTPKQILIAFNVLGNRNHSSNNGRSERQEKDGLVRLVALK
jgi:hypothetical protein